MNASESPLLRLPPEIRNTIWSMVFSSMKFHIDLKNRRGPLTRDLCNYTTSDFEQVKEIKGGTFEDQKSSYSDVHARCASTTTGNDPFALLKACSQTYAETSLLAYSTCQFSFCDFNAFEGFLKAIMPRQASMVQEVSIVLGADKLLRLFGLKDLIHQKLTSVDRVAILLESTNVDVVFTISAINWGNSYTNRGAALFPSSMSSVAIAMYSPVGTHPRNVITAAQARSWEFELEEAVLQVR